MTLDIVARRSFSWGLRAEPTNTHSDTALFCGNSSETPIVEEGDRRLEKV